MGDTNIENMTSLNPLTNKNRWTERKPRLTQKVQNIFAFIKVGSHIACLYVIEANDWRIYFDLLVSRIHALRFSWKISHLGFSSNLQSPDGGGGVIPKNLKLLGGNMCVKSESSHITSTKTRWITMHIIINCSFRQVNMLQNKHNMKRLSRGQNLLKIFTD